MALVKYVDENFLSFVLVSLVAMFCTIMVEYYIGCNRRERAFVVDKINKLRTKIRK